MTTLDFKNLLDFKFQSYCIAVAAMLGYRYNIATPLAYSVDQKL